MLYKLTLVVKSARMYQIYNVNAGLIVQYQE